MAGPESRSVVTDTEEESSLQTSEKVKRKTYFELTCIGYGM